VATTQLVYVTAVLCKFSVKYNIQVVFMHARLFVKGVLRDFMKKGDSLTCVAVSERHFEKFYKEWRLITN
jgi:hypothetical protein